LKYSAFTEIAEKLGACDKRYDLFVRFDGIVGALDAFRVLCSSRLPISIEMHEAALKIAEEHGYNICEALVVAAALEAGCATLYFETFTMARQLMGNSRFEIPSLDHPASSFCNSKSIYACPFDVWAARNTLCHDEEQFFM
jgi:hypothetical protein